MSTQSAKAFDKWQVIGTTQTNIATNEHKNAQISEKVKIQRISLESNLCKYFFYFHICSITCKKISIKIARLWNWKMAPSEKCLFKMKP